MIKESFGVKGMMCAMCVGHVRKAIERLEGVKEVNVNLASNSALIEYDEQITTPERIREAVVAAGYDMDATPLSVIGEEEQQDSQKKKQKSFLKKLFGH